MKTWSVFFIAVVLSNTCIHANPTHPAGAFRASCANLPVFFETNTGQADATVEFLAHGQNGDLLLTRNTVWLALHKTGDQTEPRLVGINFAGANPSFQLEGLDPLPGKANYIIGNDPRRWHTDVPTFGRVKYHDVYPGVDLVYYGNQQALEYDLVVQPGANPNDIMLQFSGAETITLDAGGNLLLGPPGEAVRQHKPVVYQEINGERKMLAGNYVLHAMTEVGIEVADYDHARPLIIDPVLSYSGTFGGSGLSQALAITLDAYQNVYVSGNTTSTNFPTTGALQSALQGGQEAFVVKFDTNNTMVYSTYIGGNATTSAQGITVDTNGDIYLTGYTAATNYPTKNALQSTNASQTSPPFNAFVTKINASGNALVYSTYLGGNGVDSANGIALDTNNDAIVTGYTSSTNFPTANAAQPIYGGNGDAFVAKLSAGGSTLIYSTFLGGNGTENIPAYWTNPNASGGAIAVDFDGNAYVTGWTYSTNFPVLNAFQSTNASAFAGFYSAAFVTELNSSGNLVYSTYFGGEYGDFGRAIGVDFNGNVYFAGNDAQGSLPTTNAFQSSFGGHGTGYELRGGFTINVGDGFVAAFDSTGTNLIYSTYLGGNSDDQVNGMAVRPEDGTVVVTGFTDSPNFPLLNPVQAAGNQGFFTSTNAAGNWSVSSPSPGNGIIYEIQVDASNPSVIYVLAGVSPGSAGTFKSTDGGNTWSWMTGSGFIPAPTSNSSNGGVLASILVEDPLNPDTLYVASGANVYQTSNGETNWNYLTYIPAGGIQSLAMDPVTTTTLYAGTASGGVYKSIDGGNTWNTVTNGMNTTDIMAVLVDPQNPAVIYAGAGDSFGNNPSLYRSIDGGTNWMLTTNGLSSQSVAGLVANADAIYAILGDTFESATLYRSTDSGLTWSQVVAVSTLNFTALAFGQSSGGAPALTIASVGSSDTLSWPATFNGYTLQSTPLLSPASWQPVAKAPATNNGNFVVTLPAAGSQAYYRLAGTNSAGSFSPAAIYLGTDQISGQGLIRSTDGGVTWNSVGFAGNGVNAVAVNPANPATVYAGLNGGRDAFVATLTPNGQLNFSTYLGGNGADQGNAIALNFEDAYVAITTSSADFPTMAVPAIAQQFKIPPILPKPWATNSPPTGSDGVPTTQNGALDRVQSAADCPQGKMFTILWHRNQSYSEKLKGSKISIGFTATEMDVPPGFLVSVAGIPGFDDYLDLEGSTTAAAGTTYTFSVVFTDPDPPICSYTNTYTIKVIN